METKYPSSIIPAKATFIIMATHQDLILLKPYSSTSSFAVCRVCGAAARDDVSRHHFLYERGRSRVPLSRQETPCAQLVTPVERSYSSTEKSLPALKRSFTNIVFTPRHAFRVASHASRTFMIHIMTHLQDARKGQRMAQV